MVKDTLELWDFVLPSLVVFGSALITIAVIVIAIRLLRRSPRAQSAAVRTRNEAASALVELDDAIEDADVELALATATYGGKAPAALARARLTAVRVRDTGFAVYQELVDAPPVTPVAKQAAVRTHSAARTALRELSAARAQHRDWLRQNANAAQQVTATRAHLQSVQATLGNAATRDTELAARFAPSEVIEVMTPTARAKTQLEQAQHAIQRASTLAEDPTKSALDDLADAERAIRAAETAASAADQAYARLDQASAVVQEEFTSVRAQVQEGVTLLADTPAEATERMTDALRDAQSRLDALEADAQRKPLETITALARIRGQLDLAIGDARSARARLDGAKSALPGTIATARALIGRAESKVAASSNGAARIRLSSAREELTRSRNASDAVEALDAARRAIRHAEDADALAST